MKIACGFTIPITLYGLPPTLEETLSALKAIRDADFEAVEMELVAGKMDDYVISFSRLKETFQNLDLELCCLMAVVDQLFTPQKTEKEQALKDFKVITGLARELSSKFISLCAYLPKEIRPVAGSELYVGGPSSRVEVREDFSWPDFWKNAVDQLARCAEIAAEREMGLLVETRANDFLSSTDAVMNVLQETGAPNVGVILDVAHVHAGKEYLELVIPKLDGLIKLVHLSDNDGSQAYHYAPGKGNIDFLSVLKSLKRIGFDDYLVVDISGVDNILEEALRAKIYFEDCLKKI